MSRVVLDSTTCEFRCPGCGQWHVLPIGEGALPRWQFSGDAHSPTLSPSIAARGLLAVFSSDGEWTGEYVLDASGKPVPYVCHSFLRSGRLEFLGDSTHALAGQTVDLPYIGGAQGAT